MRFHIFFVKDSTELYLVTGQLKAHNEHSNFYYTFRLENLLCYPVDLELSIAFSLRRSLFFSLNVVGKLEKLKHDINIHEKLSSKLSLVVHNLDLESNTYT